MVKMGDSLTVLGSRLGFGFDPAHKQSYLIRHGKHPGIPLNLHAGIKLEDRVIELPLTRDCQEFSFVDQRMTPTSISYIGIDSKTGLKVKLVVRIPFRPRDIRFSVTPVIFFEVSISRLDSYFRWQPSTTEAVRGKLFLGFENNDFDFQSLNDKEISVSYASPVGRPEKSDWDICEFIRCQDRLVFQQPSENQYTYLDFSLVPGEDGPTLSAYWACYDKAVLEVGNELCSFKYSDYYSNLDEVCQWADKSISEVKLNSCKVDSIILENSLGTAVNNLLTQTLHSWLMNSWWVKKKTGQDWFMVWEGTCYLHSTLDVEYTQGPFYLSVWPELLELQLNEWPEFIKSGELTLGKDGQGTLFMSHDMGLLGKGSGQFYTHEMEVEENCNYLLLAYAHWRRTGNTSVLNNQSSIWIPLLEFIRKTDTTGNGIPDKGCANTLDDGSPAVQFGKKQIYLGIKSALACLAGADILEYLNFYKEARVYHDFAAKGIKAIEDEGWNKDHYAVALNIVQEDAINPWTGELWTGPLIGWDAYHIYTPNTFALLHMVNRFTEQLDFHRLKEDIQAAIKETLTPYGCRHSSFINRLSANINPPQPSKVGWISMNILRDMTALYRGIDLTAMSQRYWDWQTTTNSQEFTGFFESFSGNNLHYYPRGIAVYGLLEAAAGYSWDKVADEELINPVNHSIKVPILAQADWVNGKVSVISSFTRKEEIYFEIYERIFP